MSTFKNNGVLGSSQTGLMDLTISRYQNLVNISNQLNSPALKAGSNYAQKLMIACNQIQRKIALIKKPKGLFATWRLQRAIEPLKELLNEQLERLASWLDSIFIQFKSKYESLVY